MLSKRSKRGCIIEYRLTEKGRTADVKPTPAGKVLEFLQDGHGVVNTHEVSYELSMPNAQDILDNLVRAGYVSKEEESDNPFGG